MDEIDAALDFKNVSIVANYIKERTRNAQFIIISLRSNMFENADRLVGIYKTYNATKSVTINPAKIVQEEWKHLSFSTTTFLRRFLIHRETWVQTNIFVFPVVYIFVFAPTFVEFLFSGIVEE